MLGWEVRRGKSAGEAGGPADSEHDRLFRSQALALRDKKDVPQNASANANHSTCYYRPQRDTGSLMPNQAVRPNICGQGCRVGCLAEELLMKGLDLGFFVFFLLLLEKSAAPANELL